MRPAEARWRVAIVDSGLRPVLAAQLSVSAHCHFEDDGRAVMEKEPRADVSGHGTRVAQVIASASHPPSLLVAQALDAQGRATAAAIAAAVNWSSAQGADLIHLSLGLSQDRAVLAQAVGAAQRAGVLLVASAPARGALPYPAAYPGVIVATGDARCGREQISTLGRPGADFGGCVLRAEVVGAEPSRGGASIGAAHVSRFIVQHLMPGSAAEDARKELTARAAFRGRERRMPGSG